MYHVCSTCCFGFSGGRHQRGADPPEWQSRAAAVTPGCPAGQPDRRAGPHQQHASERKLSGLQQTAVRAGAAVSSTEEPRLQSELPQVWLCVTAYKQ